MYPLKRLWAVWKCFKQFGTVWNRSESFAIGKEFASTLNSEICSELPKIEILKSSQLILLNRIVSTLIGKLSGHLPKASRATEFGTTKTGHTVNKWKFLILQKLNTLEPENMGDIKTEVKPFKNLKLSAGCPFFHWTPPKFDWRINRLRCCPVNGSLQTEKPLIERGSRSKWHQPKLNLIKSVRCFRMAF